MSQKPHPGRYVTPSVGDKLQSCRQECFTASAESDKFCPLCSTNHCSLSRTRPHPPPGRERGREAAITLLIASRPHVTHTHTLTLCIHWLSDGSQSKNTVWVLSASLSLVTRQKTLPLCVCVFFFCDLQETRKNAHHSTKHFHIYHSLSFFYTAPITHTHTHTQCIHL